MRRKGRANVILGKDIRAFRAKILVQFLLILQRFLIRLLGWLNLIFFFFLSRHSRIQSCFHILFRLSLLILRELVFHYSFI